MVWYELVGESWGAHLLITDPIDLSPYAAKVNKAIKAGVEIRSLMVNDIPDVIQLELENGKDYPFTPATRHSVPTADELKDLIVSTGAVFGAFIQKRLIGVLATKKNPESVEFEFASISSEYRGKSIASGIGSYAIIEYVKESSISFATGGAAVNDSSRGAVESLGFTIDECWKSYKVPT